MQKFALCLLMILSLEKNCCEWIHDCRARHVRTIREFCEQEFTIAKGKLRGTRWRPETSPFQALLLDQMTNLQVHESSKRRWRRFAITGCVQSGKSLVAFVAPIMYHLFEIGEDVIALVPSVDEIGRDKWNKELRPAIEASRFAKWLPTSGPGSQGGFGSEITFGNGCSLKFMSGSGGDEKRSSYTARVLVATEVDKMDTAGDASREADPITQAEGRLKSYLPEERVVYLECTVSIEEGCIWQAVKKGSDSRIVKRCPHCREWVCPEREHLRGFEQATNEFEAEAGGHIVCPSCGETITEAERKEMNRTAKLVHRGQEIDCEGNITGELPPTWTLGFRWNAFDNHSQLTIAGLALEEWQITEAENEQAKEKAACQFVWTTPYKPPTFDLEPLKLTVVRERFSVGFTRDQVPLDAETLVGAIDCGKRHLHWGLCAYRPEARGVIIAYGRWENPPCEGDEAVHIERAILDGLRGLRDEVFLRGFAKGNETWLPQQVLVDAGYMPGAVYAFAADQECGERFRPTIGRGSTQSDKRYRSYRHPKKTNSEIVHIGDEYYIVWDHERNAFRLEANADHWKVQLFRALHAPVDGPGALGFFHSTNPKEHQTIAKHLTAERPFEAFEPGKGTVTKWMVVSDVNHYLDVSYLLCVAGHLCGVRVIDQDPQTTGETTIEGSDVFSSRYATGV